MSLIGTVTGMGFTAGLISQSLSIKSVLLALMPFITCFGAIALNCLKKRWWILGAIALIILAMLFFKHTSVTHDVILRHAPEVTPDNDLGEGFSIIGLGIGYKLSFILVGLALLSAIISILPFKFNERIQKAMDDTFEGGRRHVREEFNRIENNLRKPHKVKEESPTPQTGEQSDWEPPIEEDKENPSRFMPPEQ